MRPSFVAKQTQAPSAMKSVSNKPIKHKLVDRTNDNVALLPDAKRAKARGNTGDVTSTADQLGNTNQREMAEMKLKSPQLDGANDIVDKKNKSKANAKSRSKPKDDSNSDSDFEAVPQKRIRPKVTPAKPVKSTKKSAAKPTKIDNRVFSTDDENDVVNDTNTIKMNFWVEAYAEKEKKWITIDPVKKKVDCIDYVRVSDFVRLYNFSSKWLSMTTCHSKSFFSTETCIKANYLCLGLEQ